VKSVSAATRDAFPTTQLFRNCETNSQAVYAVEVTGEDTATLHHVVMTGDQAIVQDANFFKKVFCVNSLENNWYTMGSDYTSLSQIPPYVRGQVFGATPTPAPVVTPTPTPSLTPTPSATPTPTPTPTPTATPVPEPTITSVSIAPPSTLKHGDYFRIYGTNFLNALGVYQVKFITVGPVPGGTVTWPTTTGVSIPDAGTIITTMQSNYVGTWDVSITSLDGTISTLHQAIIITQ